MDEVKDRKDLNVYSNLEFNQETWMADLCAHILVRRFEHWSGAESQARKEEKVSIDHQCADGVLLTLYCRKLPK